MIFGMEEIVEDIVRHPMDYHRTWSDSPILEGSAFRVKRPVDPPGSIPPPEAWSEGTPKPFWDGHDDVIACYRRAWEIAGTKIRGPEPGSGFTRVFRKSPLALHSYICLPSST